MKTKLKRLLPMAMFLLLLLAVPTVALADEGEGDGDGDKMDSAVCSGEKEHPVIVGLAETYEATSYDEIVGFFCDGYGLGEIMLAYETANATGGSAADLLGQKGQGNGWGKIWKELGLIGNEKDGGPPPWAGRGKPDWAGPPAHSNSKNNRPDDQDDKPGNDKPGNGKNEDKGKPGNPNCNGSGNPNCQANGGDDDVDENEVDEDS